MSELGSLPTWEQVHDTIEKLAAWPEDDTEWHVPRGVADRAIAAMRDMEKQGYPVPRLWPFEGTDLILVWRADGWTIYQHFCGDGEPDHVEVRYHRRTPAPTGMIEE